MSLSDLLDIADVIEFITAWRFWLPAAIGIGVGFLIYSAAQGPVALFFAACFGIGGLLCGVMWQYQYERST